MKSIDQIQRAHDILHQVITGPESLHKEMGLSEKSLIRMEASLVTLCWMLEHKSGETFEGNMEETMRVLSSLGYDLEDTQHNYQ